MLHKNRLGISPLQLSHIPAAAYHIVMKIPSSSSILLATLAISSSSSALVTPATDSHQEGDMYSSASQDDVSCAQNTVAYSEPDNGQNSVAARGLLDTLPCSLVTTITHVLPLNLATVTSLLCSDNEKKRAEDNRTDAQKAASELDQLTNILGGLPLPLPAVNNIIPPLPIPPLAPLINSLPLPVPLSPLINSIPLVNALPIPILGGSSSTSSTPASNSSSASASSNTHLPNSTDSSSASRVSAINLGPHNNTTAASTNSTINSSGTESYNGSSMSPSTAWRIQPTPTNSPSLPVNYPMSANATSTNNSTAIMASSTDNTPKGTPTAT